MSPTQMASSGQASELPPSRATFILRLQREPHGPERARWRGVIEHVQSGERRAVDGAESAAALIVSWLHTLEDPPFQGGSSCPAHTPPAPTT